MTEPLAAAREFWNVVATPAEPDEYQVGKAVLIESHRGGETTSRVVIVTRAYVGDDGKNKVEIRELEPGEQPPHPTLVILAEDPW